MSRGEKINSETVRIVFDMWNTTGEYGVTPDMLESADR